MPASFACRLSPLIALLATSFAGVANAEQPANVVELTTQLHSTDASQRLKATLQLLEMGEAARPVYPELVALLVDDEQLDVAVAAQTLFAKPHSSTNAAELAKALAQDTQARATAAWQICQIGAPAGDGCTQALVNALQFPDKHERNFIVAALAVAGRPSQEVVAALQTVLEDAGSADTQQTNYKYPRAAAAVALAAIGPEASDATPALIATLDEPKSWEYQRAANCFALGRIGPAAKAALPELNRALSDSRPLVRTQAAWAVQAINQTTTDDRDVAALLRALSEGSSRIDLRVVAGLQSLGEFAGVSRAVGKKKSRPPVHESIALAIGYVDSLPTPPSPVEVGRDYEAGRLSGDFRQYMMALGGVQQGIGPALLEGMTQGEQDARVIACRRLASLGPSARDAIPALLKAMEDADWIIRREAFLALRRIQGTK